MKYIRVPSLEENINQVTLALWLVKPGQKITPNLPLAELITEKAEFTLTAQTEVTGTLLHVLAQEKSILPVGYILAVVGGKNELPNLNAINKENENLKKMLIAEIKIDFSQLDKTAISPSFLPDKIRATPAARRLARELGIELVKVAEGIKKNKPIRESDVQIFVKDKQNN